MGKPAKFFLGVFVLIGALGWIQWAIERSEAPLKEVSSPSSAPVVATAAPRAAVPAALSTAAPKPAERGIQARTSATPRSEAGKPYPQLEGNMVEFRIVDGLAVAHGDVILGKPEPGFSGKVAITESPTPELWPSRNIPYAIAKNIADVSRVETALDYLRKHTALRFVPYSGEGDAIIFQRGEKHCYSYLGRIKGAQPIFLSDGCGWNEILHEVLHALGFIHEQSRPDRDQYVEVMWENIQDEYRPQFARAPEIWTEALRGSTFDFNSIMMYPATAFAKTPGQATLRPKINARIAPVKTGLSYEDIRRINKVYGLYE